MNPSTSFSIYPLGDSAITIDLGNNIDEQLNGRARAIHDWLRTQAITGIADIVIAYSSVSVFYDPACFRESSLHYPNGVFFWWKELMERAWAAVMAMPDHWEGGRGILRGITGAGDIIRIPVCYEREFGPDLEWVAARKGLLPADIISLHSSAVYLVYMVGFLPGFPYMGKIDPLLEIQRKERPIPILAGGVGIAGIQTGIYPLNSPGGWQIIGRTPLKLFEWQADPPIRFKSGDRVQFYPISRDEFQDWKANR